MNVLVVYDSQFGNTEKIALAIGKAIQASHKVRVVQADQASIKDLSDVSLLIAGSPTQGGRAKKHLLSFLEKVQTGMLRNIKVAAFDTRFLEKDQRITIRLLMKVIGYAAPKIADTLTKKGGSLVGSPEGFIVNGKEGPLKEGELERAELWVKTLVK